jgi:4-diphosphocytidyl-2-C-methyl-D-erythritol kinase
VLRLAAPAKINLGLRVTGRRPDGYHELESVFLPLAAEGPLADAVELARRDAPGVALDLRGAGPDVPADDRNLALRAAQAFLARAGLAGGASVALEKRIPAGAGLGGGSSDAGAVLRGFAALEPRALPAEALAELALGLGADVPFFLDPSPALVRGIGERREPLPHAPALALVVVHPGVPLATAAVFRAFAAGGAALTPAGALPRIRALPRRPGEESREAWAERVRNDLEPTATALCPAIADLRALLCDAGALAVAMSGSGPAVYGVFESEERRDQGFAQLALAPPARAWATATAASPPHAPAGGLW